LRNLNPDDSIDTVTVLMIDDEENQLKISTMGLKDVDPSLKIVSALTPTEALRLLRSRIFDCVVSDYAMPEMDGVKLYYEVRKISDIPFILYTGYRNEEIAEKAFRAGVDDFVRKEKSLGHFQLLANRIRQTVNKYRTETH
jgi:DNA-binding NtrC family response regulator